MPIMFSSLLASFGIAPSDVILLRHTDQTAIPGRSPYDLWQHDREAFELYQSHQNIERRTQFSRASYWASFVVSPEALSVFVGLYRAEYRGLLSVDVQQPHTREIDRAGSCDVYSLVIDTRLQHLEGNFSIEWGEGFKQWVQRADRQDKEVIGLAPDVVASLPNNHAPRSANNQPNGNPDWSRDEHILALDLYLSTRNAPPSKDGREILELSRTLNRLGERLFPPDARQATFRNAAGVYMKLMNFRRLDPLYTVTGRVGLTRGASGELEVWNEFSHDPDRCKLVASAILATLDTNEGATIPLDPDEDDGIEEAPEGRLLTRRHLARERNRRLVTNKIKSTLKALGTLRCEVCSFDFAAVYGSRGNGFIECHHTKPVCSLAQESTTHVRDLALLCANCHRIIHRKQPWLSIDELKSLISNLVDAQPRLGK